MQQAVRSDQYFEKMYLPIKPVWVKLTMKGTSLILPSSLPWRAALTFFTACKQTRLGRLRKMVREVTKIIAKPRSVSYVFVRA